MNKLLQVDNLGVSFDSSQGPVRAVDGMSFDISSGETLAIVGESGSGKSTTAMAIMRLISTAAARTRGQAVFQGEDLFSLSDRGMRAVRGARIGMIFQDPMMALNPVYTIGRQISEPLILHLRLSRSEALDRAIDLLRMVGVPDPTLRVNQYPHNLSGGMRQRVMIAMALACRPALLIADEPTTALDVTVQAQVLKLISELKHAQNMAVLLITHDLGVVSEVAQRVIVMYGGRKMEGGSVDEIFSNPLHPYTQGLIGASDWSDGVGGRMKEIPGTVPSSYELPAGCPFAPRCSVALGRCMAEMPSEIQVSTGHSVACFVAAGAIS